MMHRVARVTLFILCFQQFAAATSFVFLFFNHRRCVYSSADCHVVSLSSSSDNNIVIQQINQDCNDDLEEFSTFCIQMFYDNNKRESNSFVSRKWKDLKLAMLQKAQMIDLSVPFNGNRSVFIARACTNEIVGCSEVIEERVIISQDRNARVRPIVENLAVKEEYRRQGVGKALLEACEKNVQTWIPLHDHLFAQVEDGNTEARDFFINRGYEVVFSDTDCKKDDLEGLAFRQTKITKFMLRKVL